MTIQIGAKVKGYLLSGCCLLMISAWGQKQHLYHDGWIDFNKNGSKDIFEDPAQTVDKRVDDLLSQMNLNEKSCQMATLYGYGRVLKDEQPTPEWKNEVWKDGIANIDEELNNVPGHHASDTKYAYPFSTHAKAINTVQHWFVEETRLGIPVDFTNEGIHGLCSEKATPLPAPISIGSTWDKALVRKAGQVVGREAKALGYTNIYAPILDPARDPRWGRVVECYGESPFLIAGLGTEMVKGIQEAGVASTLKHFAVYSHPKGGRDGSVRTDPHVAPKEMHEIYLYPFQKVIERAHPLGVMSSYNDWDGEVVTGSHYFLTELLRQKFGFKGYVVSDSKAVEFLYSKNHVARDFEDATREAVNAGLNVWTNFADPAAYIHNVRHLVQEGRLSISTVNSRVRDVLKVKFLLGLFDQPYVADPDAADHIVHNAAADSMQLKMNRESMVLLKNDNSLLPLAPGKYHKILITGELGKDAGFSVSRYGPGNNKVVSTLDGIKELLQDRGSKSTIDYQEGAKVVNSTWPAQELIRTPMLSDEKVAIAQAVEAAKTSDLVIAVLGENNKTVGESKSRSALGLPGRQLELLQALYATGKPVVLVLIAGQPLTINWASKNIPAILNAGFPGTSGGTAIAETLFGQYNPGGKLSITWPRSVGQVPFNFPFKKGSQLNQGSQKDPNGYGSTRANGALYPFGYGLSYTSFGYSHLKVTPNEPHTAGNIEVAVDVTNKGKVSGEDVVQLYISDLMSSVTTYASLLRGFERIQLRPGETKTVHFELTPDDLALLNKDMHRVVEPGEFEIRIGQSSKDIVLKQKIEVL